jgi:hypothetical protein
MDFGRRKLLGILSGGWLAQACYAVVKLGVPDLLTAGPRTAGELADATGAHPVALARLLRALAAAGLLSRSDAGYALTSTGELLRSDVEGSLAANAVMHGEEVFRSFADIMHTVRTGEPAFAHVYGQPFYDYLDAHPEAAAGFHASMGDQPAPSGWADCDLSGVGSLCDVGGGNGALLADVLAAHPSMRGVLVERPDAARAARGRFTATGLAGVAGVADRVDIVESSFFDGVPAGHDAYVLARVLHNWTDEHALDILGRIHEAAAPGARLIVLEELMPDDGAGGASAVGLVDLLMLVTLEGFDRTATQYGDLLDKGGFAVTAVHPGRSVAAGGAIEAVRR